MTFLSFTFLPEQASVLAREVDALYLYLVGISVFFMVAIFSVMAFFVVKYRRRSEAERPRPIHGNNLLEILWTIIPLLITMTVFGWGASLYFKSFRPPADALEIFAVGKQWMWKIQHPSGVREINELHIPTGHPVKVTLTSEDVIHSFYVPAFRVKMDAVPGRYSQTWFEAEKSGKYRLLCAEYCGTDHSQMTGWIHVLTPDEYRQWVADQSDRASTGPLQSMTPGRTVNEAVAAGEKLFVKFRCLACHHAQSGALGPDLTGIFGTTVTLEGGKTQVVDADYIRESMIEPNAKIVQGYAALMPTYQKLLDEQQSFAIISYIKSLGTEAGDKMLVGQPTSPEDPEGEER